MAKLKKTNIQNYPRIEDEEDQFHGFFDELKVTPHKQLSLMKNLEILLKEPFTLLTQNHQEQF